MSNDSLLSREQYDVYETLPSYNPTAPGLTNVPPVAKGEKLEELRRDFHKQFRTLADYHAYKRAHFDREAARSGKTGHFPDLGERSSFREITEQADAAMKRLIG